RQIDVRAQELDVVLYLCGHCPLDASKRIQRVVELTFLKVNASESERSFVSHGFIDGALEHGLDGAACAVVHTVVQLEITYVEFGIVDVIVQRIELGLIETSVHRELGV